MKVLLKFGMVGGLGFLTDLTILTVLFHLGGGPLSARIASFSCAVLVTFVLNRVVTFQARGQIFRQLMSYLSASFLGLLVNWAVYYWGLSFSTPQISLFFASAAAMVVNFLLYKFVVFPTNNK